MLIASSLLFAIFFECFDYTSAEFTRFRLLFLRFVSQFRQLEQKCSLGQFLATPDFTSVTNRVSIGEAIDHQIIAIAKPIRAYIAHQIFGATFTARTR